MCCTGPRRDPARPRSDQRVLGQHDDRHADHPREHREEGCLEGERLVAGAQPRRHESEDDRDERRPGGPRVELQDQAEPHRERREHDRADGEEAGDHIGREWRSERVSSVLTRASLLCCGCGEAAADGQGRAAASAVAAPLADAAATRPTAACPPPQRPPRAREATARP